MLSENAQSLTFELWRFMVPFLDINQLLVHINIVNPAIIHTQ